MKYCPRCQQTKAIECFGVDNRAVSGLKIHCKECKKTERAATREYHRQYEATYYKKPEVKARRAAQMKSYTNDPERRPRHEARWMVHRAIDAGRLVRQPCEVCGTPKTDAHHDDYSKPLDVRWLCRPHHNEHHAKVQP